MRITIYILAIVFLGWSCGPRSGVSNEQAKVDSITFTPDVNQVRYVKNTIDIGSRVYKMNCAVCHCGPGTHCEPPSGRELQYVFHNLPMDSLEHYSAYIKNSELTEKGLRKNPLLKNPNEYNYVHEFGKTLSDSLIKAVTEFLWLARRTH